ncbi:hypothetical protein [Halocalculus aciditolerans]|uniref:Uncharacterized protein n=1 Tax=Halocalculus aciditolerans TaxID=1383812 RepID=A0A830F991_9EURY|nr:hypothetical protein [Halocalculus aciditolerans]GGL51685.1 hypothetical protein GCM10009039_07500 [Halocalculus aciditolerans]
MTEGMSVPPNWTHDDPDWGEDVGRKYDPHAVVEYEHVDLDLWLVLAPGRVPERVADDERGYRIDARWGDEPGDYTTLQLAVTPDLASAHAVAADVMRLFTEFYAPDADIARLLDRVAGIKTDDWQAEHDAVRPTAALHA